MNLTPRLYIFFFSFSTQPSIKFHQLIKTKISTNEDVSCLALSLPEVIFIMLINVKMQTIVTVVISTFMSRINFVLS